MKYHVDGSSCLEGIQGATPENYTPCCESFDRHTRACHFDIRYVWNENSRQWGIQCMDGSYIVMLFCPHCAAKVSDPLPTSERPPLDLGVMTPEEMRVSRAEDAAQEIADKLGHAFPKRSGRVEVGQPLQCVNCGDQAVYDAGRNTYVGDAVATECPSCICHKNSFPNGARVRRTRVGCAVHQPFSATQLP